MKSFVFKALSKVVPFVIIVLLLSHLNLVTVLIYDDAWCGMSVVVHTH